MENLYWFYDVCVIGILIIAVYCGAKKGLMKSVVMTVLIVASFIVSWFAAEAVGPFVYDKFVKDIIVDAFMESAENKDPAGIVSSAISAGDYGVDMSPDDVNAIIESKPDFFSELASSMRKNGSPENEEVIRDSVENSVTPMILDVLLDDIVSSDYIRHALDTVGEATGKVGEVVSAFISGSREEVAYAAEQNLIAPVLIWLFKAIVFVVLMLVLRLIIGPVSNAFKAVNKIPIVGPVNVLFGGVLGAVEGLIVVYVISIVIKAVVNVTGSSLIFLNTQTINMTKLFLKFYNFDIIGYWFK